MPTIDAVQPAQGKSGAARSHIQRFGLAYLATAILVNAAVVGAIWYDGKAPSAELQVVSTTATPSSIPTSAEVRAKPLASKALPSHPLTAALPSPKKEVKTTTPHATKPRAEAVTAIKEPAIENSTVFKKPSQREQAIKQLQTELKSIDQMVASEASDSGTDSSDRQRSNSDPYADIPSLIELPAITQAQIPSLSVSVHMYSEISSEAIILVGGREYRQNDRLPGGITLVRIDPNSLILDFRGTVYRQER